MRRIYWSIPALLLAGAVAWAQQPGLAPSVPSPPMPIEAEPASSVDLLIPRVATPSVQVFPAATRTIREDGNGNVLYDSGVIPPAARPEALMLSRDPFDVGADSMSSGGPMRDKQVQRTVIETQYVPLSPTELEEQRTYQAAVATLKSDEPAEKKELARKQLMELLSVGFDRDLETRESDLKDLESRVQKLRSQLEKRTAAKQEIIDLRLKTIQNEADGLEYPGAATQPAGTPIRREPGAPADGT